MYDYVRKKLSSPTTLMPPTMTPLPPLLSSNNKLTKPPCSFQPTTTDTTTTKEITSSFGTSLLLFTRQQSDASTLLSFHRITLDTLLCATQTSCRGCQWRWSDWSIAKKCRLAVVMERIPREIGCWSSVGGRSGWARKKQRAQETGFVSVDTFRATEGWMGNHMFLCKGKIMLGSDGPLFLFTNGLLLAGILLYFFLVLPKLASAHDPHWLVHPITFWSSITLSIASFVFLWISATMDPGILPAVSSPVKPAVPSDNVPLGGPLGYRYCSTCNIFRPPRSKHCNSCNVCVSKFDQYVFCFVNLSYDMASHV